MIPMLLAAVLLAVPSLALNNGLARKPQMGYNTWYSFQCALAEDELRAEVYVAADRHRCPA